MHGHYVHKSGLPEESTINLLLYSQNVAVLAVSVIIIALFRKHTLHIAAIVLLASGPLWLCCGICCGRLCLV